MGDSSTSHIVVGLDADGLADHAVVAALELASIFSADLEIVHALRTPGVIADLRAFEGASNESARSAADRRAALAHLDALWTRAQLARPRPRFDELLRVEVGRPAECLTRRARARDADLVVLGARHPRVGLSLGGTVREMLASSPCSVWIQATPVRRIRRVLAATDLSRPSEHAVAAAVALAREMDAAVTLLHAFDATGYAASAWPDGWNWVSAFPIDAVRQVSEREFRAAAERVAWDGVAHETIFVDDAASRAILERAADHDLVVIGTHGRGSALPSVLGGTAWTVIRDSPVPVMATRFDAR